MDKEQIIATLCSHESELHRRGIRHVALFGSVARGVARATSDIDILIELEPDAPIGVFDYVALTDYLGALFPVRTDIANFNRDKSWIFPSYFLGREAMLMCHLDSNFPGRFTRQRRKGG